MKKRDTPRQVVLPLWLFLAMCLVIFANAIWWGVMFRG